MQGKRYTRKTFAVRDDQSAISDNHDWTANGREQRRKHDGSSESQNSNPRVPLAGAAEQRNGHGPVVKFNGRNAHDQRCERCDVAIDNLAQYWHHKRMHMDPGRMKACPTCDYVTHQNALLAHHMVFHSAVKPFACPQCDYKCVNKSMLKSHFKKHLDVYPYRCDVCPFRSKYNNSWQAHLKSKKHYKSTMVAQRQPDRAETVKTPTPKSSRERAAFELRSPATADGRRELETETPPPPPPPQTIARAAKSHDDGKMNRLVCNFCDLQFDGNVLYVKHMGYHCFGDPLTCNMCGEVMNDTSSFLSHVTRVPVHD